MLSSQHSVKAAAADFDWKRKYPIHSQTYSKDHLYVKTSAYNDHILQLPGYVLTMLLNLHINTK